MTSPLDRLKDELKKFENHTSWRRDNAVRFMKDAIRLAEAYRAVAIEEMGDSDGPINNQEIENWVDLDAQEWLSGF